jgi:Zn-dependent M28 family amino/carboxypeptidase
MGSDEMRHTRHAAARAARPSQVMDAANAWKVVGLRSAGTAPVLGPALGLALGLAVGLALALAPAQAHAHAPTQSPAASKPKAAAAPAPATAKKPAAARAADTVASPPSPVAVDRIQASHIAAHVKFLADDLLEGRAPGTRGGDVAARYIAAQFELLGLEPAGEQGTWYQQVPIIESTTKPGFTLTAKAGGSGGGAGKTEAFTFGTDIVAASGLDEPSVAINAPVIFVGYGIVAPEFKWNDYAGLDVKGKIVLVMVNDPPAPPSEPTLFAGKALTYYGRWIYKFEEAARQGAAGALLIHTPESATYPWQVVQSSWSGTQYRIPTPAGVHALRIKAWVSEEAANRLAAAGGKNLDDLRKAATERGAKAVDLGVSVEGALEQQVNRKTSPNVIGVLKGTKADESIIYSAHYDHLGKHDAPAGKDGIYNGARDNASGVATILDIAQAFAATKTRPARSVYFLSTTGEESGLLGSEYLATHPLMPIDKIAANFNVDSVNVYGRATELVLLGVERSSLKGDVEQAVRRWHRTLGQDAHPDRGYFFRSDHFPLAKVGVPAVSITLASSSSFVGPNAARAGKLAEAYNETCYHQPCDEYSADWDLTGAVDDARLLADLGWRVANAPQMPHYNADEQFARPRSGTH